MNKAEFIATLAARLPHLPEQEVDRAVRSILETISHRLAAGGRIEIRGFGRFSVHHRRPRLARNPKTGAAITVQDRWVPHFRPAKELRGRVDTPSE